MTISSYYIFLVSAIGFSLDAFCEICILILFIKPLLELSRRAIIDHQNMQILEAAIRYTLLTAVVLLSLIALGVTFSVEYYWWWKYGENAFEIWMMHGIGAIDPVINIICLTLYYHFSSSRKIYNV